MFVWWLIKRAAKPVIDEWNRPAIEGKQCSGKEDFYALTLLSIWAVVLLTCCFLALKSGNVLWVFLGVLSCIPITGAVYIPNAYRYLSKLHTQYRAEQPEKPKRKRKNGTVSMDESPVYFEDNTGETGDLYSVLKMFNDAVNKFDGKGE